MPSRLQFKVVLEHVPDVLHEEIATQLGPLLVESHEHDEDETLFLVCPLVDSDLQRLAPGRARLALVSTACSGPLTDALVLGRVHGILDPDRIKPDLMRACVETWQRFVERRDSEARESAPASAPEDQDEDEERRLLSLMVNSMADGLIMSERSRDEVLINPAARALLEIDANFTVTRRYLQEKLGFYPFDLVAANPDSTELLREELSIGDKRLHSMVSPVRESTGALVAVVVVLRDFTEAHALAHRQEEFVAIVSHELRSPLTSIGGALDIALSDYAGRLNDKQRQYLTLARESCSALNHIVDDLLDVARSESGGMIIHFGPVDLSQVTTQAVSQYRGSALAKQIDLTLTCSHDDLESPATRIDSRKF